MRLVIDTSVLISALITTGTPPDQLFQAFRRRAFTLITSHAQLDEFTRVSRYPKLQRYFTAADAADMRYLLESVAEVLTTIPEVQYSPDPDDNPILATAIAGQADYLVSGDKRHMLSLGEVEGIPVLTARQMLER